MGSTFKKPKVVPQTPTAEEKALSRRQSAALDKELEEENRRKKSLLNSTLGVSSLSAASGDGAPLSLLTGVRFGGASRPGMPRTSGKKGASSTASLLSGGRPGTFSGGTNVGGSAGGSARTVRTV